MLLVHYARVYGVRVSIILNFLLYCCCSLLVASHSNSVELTNPSGTVELSPIMGVLSCIEKKIAYT